jgi:hypothetical protein
MRVRSIQTRPKPGSMSPIRQDRQESRGLRRSIPLPSQACSTSVSIELTP